jgi:5,10-methylenetetrahydromethanopterin reductase
MRALLAGEEIEWNGGIIGLRHGPLSGVRLPAKIPLWVAAHGPKGYAVGERTADGIVTNPTHGSRNERSVDPARISVQFFGTVLDDGEEPSSERVLHAAGPAAAFQLHIGGEGIVGDSAEWARYSEQVEAIDERRRHLEMHGGHLIEVSELERPLITPELIRATTETGPAEEVAERVAEIAAEGTGGVLFGPQGHDIERELAVFAEAVGLAPVA